MGCDIHTHVEVFPGPSYTKLPEWKDANSYYRNTILPDVNEPEFLVQEICGKRNYAFFAYLAGVRGQGDSPPVQVERGIPEDANEFIQKDYKSWDTDAHSAGYVTLREVIDYKKTLSIRDNQAIFDELEEELWRVARKYLNTYDVEVFKETAQDSVRFVFWFDN